MLGQATQNVFTKVYVMLILSFYFWVLTVAGLVIAGVGPALRTVAEIYDHHGWQYREYHWHESWQTFKQVFKAANMQWWGFAIVGAILSESLYLALQFKVGWMLFIIFILIFALLLCLALGMFTMVLQSHYDVTFKVALRLAVSQFFSSFPRLLLFLGGLLMIVVFTIKWPGLILFMTVPALVLWTFYISAMWFAFVDAHLAE